MMSCVFGQHNFSFWTAQIAYCKLHCTNWLDCTLRISPELFLLLCDAERHLLAIARFLVWYGRSQELLHTQAIDTDRPTIFLDLD